MALPGLLVEYLVVGSMALLWALPLAGVDFSGQIPFGSAAALAPAIYVLGMFVDFFAFALLSQFPLRKYSLKRAVRAIAQKGLDEDLLEDNIFKDDNRRNSQGFIWLGLREPELLREVKERSSRDRIARGAFINILLLWLVSYWSTTPVFITLNNLHWFGLSALALTVWIFLERHSYRFELRIGHEVRKKETEGTITPNQAENQI